MGGKWVGFYCDFSVYSFYCDIVMLCTVVCNTVSFKHVVHLTMNIIFLLYVLYYYHMCYIITVCAF